MPSSDGGILAAVSLERSFGHVRVLRGIDLEVRVMGEGGCGPGCACHAEGSASPAS